MDNTLLFIPLDNITIGDRYRNILPTSPDILDLADSIRDKGVLQPITVNQDYQLLAGGRRVAAARLAGLTQIPAMVRYQDNTDAPVDSREVELIENVFRKDFAWDEQAKLIAEIDRLCKSKNQDWSLRKTAKLLGHSHPMNVSRSLQLADALEDMPELAKCATQDDALKTLKKFEEAVVTAELRRRQEVTKDTGLKNVLELAKSNYKIGDALEEMKALPNGAGNIHFIEVDPPYGIDLPEQKNRTGERPTTYKEVPRTEYADFLQTVAEQTYRLASSNCWMVFWFGPTHHTIVLQALREAKWEVDDIPGIWAKGHGQTLSPETYLARAYEPFFICRKGRPALNKRGRPNVFIFEPVAPSRKYHPTERPVALIEELIDTFVGINSHVLVPFLGSGATLRAMYNMGCTGWGYDLNPEYKDKFLLAVQEDTEKLNKTEDE